MDLLPATGRSVCADWPFGKPASPRRGFGFLWLCGAHVLGLASAGRWALPQKHLQGSCMAWAMPLGRAAWLFSGFPVHAPNVPKLSVCIHGTGLGRNPFLGAGRAPRLRKRTQCSVSFPSALGEPPGATLNLTLSFGSCVCFVCSHCFLTKCLISCWSAVVIRFQCEEEENSTFISSLGEFGLVLSVCCCC